MTEPYNLMDEIQKEIDATVPPLYSDGTTMPDEPVEPIDIALNELASLHREIEEAHAQIEEQETLKSLVREYLRIGNEIENGTVAPSVMAQLRDAYEALERYMDREGETPEPPQAHERPWPIGGDP